MHTYKHTYKLPKTHRLAVVGVVLRLFIIITYRCRSINIFKHDDNITGTPAPSQGAVRPRLESKTETEEEL